MGDHIGYGIKVNDEDEHLIGYGTHNMDGQMGYQRSKESLGIGTHKVKVQQEIVLEIGVIIVMK